MNDSALRIGPGRLRLVQALVIGLVLLKFLHLAIAGVLQDEAYYWMWGQHPALSYYDHPPLNAWLLGLSSAVFGWNRFALRLPVMLSFLADLFALYVFARRAAGTAWQDAFWVTALLFLTTPIFWMVSGAAVPDHLLLTCCLYAVGFFYGFFRDRAEGRPGLSRDLFLGALFLGLAGLAKYNAAFLGIGLAAFIVVHDRALLRQGRLYAAAAIAIVLQAPVVVWNFSERFASWEFILHDRHHGLTTRFDGLLPLVAELLIFVSPFLLWPLGRFAFTHKNAVPGTGFARATFVVSSVAIIGVAFTTQVLFHWNLVAYVAALPFLAWYLRPRWLLVAQAAYGVVFAVAVLVNYGIVPITDVDGWGDVATAWSYGWADAAQAVEDAAAQNHVGFIATPGYTTASLLGYYTGDRDVTSLASRTDEYDYWFDRQAHAGEDAILYGDRWLGLPRDLVAQFASVTEIDRIVVDRFGRQLNTQHIYLAKDYKPNG